MTRFVLMLAITGLGLAGACSDDDDGDGAGGSGGTGGDGGAALVCDQGHCDAAPAVCMQYGDAVNGPRPYQDTCENGGGTWTAGECPDRGVGGCRTINGTACVTTWYVTTFTAEEAQEACTNGQGLYLPP